jgi:hypothetical protein
MMALVGVLVVDVGGVRRWRSLFWFLSVWLTVFAPGWYLRLDEHQLGF